MSRNEILDLMARYTHAYDLDRLDLIGEYFTEDAEMTLRIAGGDLIGPFTGREAIAKMMTDAHEGQDDLRRHVVSNVALDNVTDSTTSAVSYLSLLQIADQHVRLLSTGRYEDELVRVDGKWLFAKRHIELDLPF